MKCCVCSAVRERDAGTVLTLTSEEKDAIRRTGQAPPDELFYCRPCYRLVSNQEQGANLLRGMLETKLRAEGHPHASEAAQEFYNLLIRGGKVMS